MSKLQNEPIEDVKVNKEIKAPELRVLDDTRQNIGVLKLEEALKIAEEKGLDLVLISPKANPPVAQIVDFDKFRYQREKELKKQRGHKAPESKRIQISARAQKNDLLTRLKKLEEFLGAGHKVEIQMVLRGREKGNKDWARAKLREFMEMIETPHKVVSEVKPGGRGLIVYIEPNA